VCPGIRENIRCRAGGPVVPGGIPALGFLSPELCVLLVREILQALKETFRKPCTVVRCQLQGFVY
jgi:hypothetical protein